MENSSNVVTNAADREVLITRVFDAPRSLVFKAWTDPAMLIQWFGPQRLHRHHNRKRCPHRRRL